MVTRHLMSVEEYLAHPEEKPYLEYVNGEALAKPVPGFDHSDIVAPLMVALAEHRTYHGGHPATEARTRFEGPEGMSILLPDVAYYAAGRRRRGATLPQPTLAVEARPPDEED